MQKAHAFSGGQRLGILGGGQLGKMIIDEVMRYDIFVGVLDPSPQAPAASYAHITHVGDFRNYEAVMEFGKHFDVLSIEIEDVHTQALRDLQKMGKKVFPQPEVIDIFRDKCIQKQFYRDAGIATSDFVILSGKPHSDIDFPKVWKSATGGYDGKGVKVLRSAKDVQELPDVPCVLEDLVPIEKELGVIVHRSVQGEIRAYSPVEMEFHPVANLVELVFAPANISKEKMDEATELAIKLAEATKIVGTLAVELFLDTNDNLLVNESAPRVHNSGHLSIEACYTSQFEQHVRAILDMPLGDTDLILPAAMGNVVGEPEFSGPVAYEGAEDLLKQKGLYLHLYGKLETRPFRKMGHITAIHTDVEEAKNIVRTFRENFKIISR